MMTTPDTIDASAAADGLMPVEVIRLGKDEMNLAEFPITLLADRVPKGKKVIQYEDQIFDEKSGKQITRKLTISADEANGLPTAVDDDVILGLIQLTKLVNNFTSREVEFNRLELIRTLGWPDSGDSYRRLATSLKRWLSVTLLYENAWRDNRQGVWTTKGFHILDNIELGDGRMMGAQGELFHSRITWNKVVFESFEAGYLKTIDYGLYLKLKLSTSKRLYRFLSKKMYFSPELSFDLRDLGITHTGLSPSYRSNAGKLKEKLQPALDELEAVGFLAPMTKEERYRKIGKDWEIRLICRTQPPAPPVDAPPTVEPSPLVAELVTRGFTNSTAAELVSQHPAEMITEKLEIFDFLTASKDKKLSRNPAGWLFKAIKENYRPPKNFESKADRQKREDGQRAAQRQDAETRRLKRAADEAERLLAEKAKAYLQSRTPEQFARLEADAIAQASEETRQNLNAPAMKPFRKTLLSGLVREHIARLVASGQLSLKPA